MSYILIIWITICCPRYDKQSGIFRTYCDDVKYPLTEFVSTQEEADIILKKKHNSLSDYGEKLIQVRDWQLLEIKKPSDNIRKDSNER